jgi:hypothetical protein
MGDAKNFGLKRTPQYKRRFSLILNKILLDLALNGTSHRPERAKSIRIGQRPITITKWRTTPP